MFCPNCGAQLPDNRIFCEKCGEVLDPIGTVAPAKTPIFPKRSPSEPPAAPVTPPAPKMPDPVPPATPKPVPPAQPITPSPVAPVQPVAPKPVKPVQPKPAKPKRETPLITKHTVINIVLAFVITLLYAGISLLLFFSLNCEETVAVNTLFDDDVVGHLTLQELLNVLLEGNRILYPTMLSTALAIGTYVFIYAVPAFSLAALIGAYLDKKATSLRVAATILTVIASAMVAILPILVNLLPDWKQAISLNTGLLYGDVANLFSLPLILFAVGIWVLVIAVNIVSAILHKRRMTK